jgi:hypothetical protein
VEVEVEVDVVEELVELEVLVEEEVDVELDVLVQVKLVSPNKKSDILFEFLNYHPHTSSAT